MHRLSDSSAGSGTSYGSGSSGGSIASSGMSINTLASYIPRFRTIKRPQSTVRHGCDTLSWVVLIFVVFGILAILLESAAYNSDFNWNLIVRADRELPVLPNEEYFNGKMVHFNTLEPALETIMSHLLRQDVIEPIAIACMTTYIVIVLISILLYTQGEGSRTTLSALHMIGGFIMFVSSILILVSDLNVDANHKLAANELQQYYQHVKANPPPISKLSLENRELLLKQLTIMIQIQDLCTLSKSQHGRYGGAWGVKFIKINGRAYTLGDFKYYGFCSREDLKFGAFFMGLIYCILCFGVPCFVCYQDRKVIKSIVVPPSYLTPSVDAMGKGGVPPAYGYGYPDLGQGQEKSKFTSGPNAKGFDPQFAPQPPRADLAVGVDYFNESDNENKDTTRNKNLARESIENGSVLAFEPQDF